MQKAAPGLPHSFSRQSRLVSKSDFQAVFANNAGKVTRKYLLVLYKPNQRLHARLGVVIGKRFIKHAVDRNRLRRVIRESFRHHQDSLKGLDLIVMIRSECSTLDKPSLRNEIDTLWQAIKN